MLGPVATRNVSKTDHEVSDAPVLVNWAAFSYTIAAVRLVSAARGLVSLVPLLISFSTILERFVLLWSLRIHIPGNPKTTACCCCSRQACGFLLVFERNARCSHGGHRINERVCCGRKFVCTWGLLQLLLYCNSTACTSKTYQVSDRCCFGKLSSMFIPWPSVFPMSSGLADVAVMVPLNAVVAAVVVCRGTGSRCRVGCLLYTSPSPRD